MEIYKFHLCKVQSEAMVMFFSELTPALFSSSHITLDPVTCSHLLSPFADIKVVQSTVFCSLSGAACTSCPEVLLVPVLDSLADTRLVLTPQFGLCTQLSIISGCGSLVS